MQEGSADGRLPERRLLNYKKLLAGGGACEATGRDRAEAAAERGAEKNPVRKRAVQSRMREAEGVYREKNVIECNCVTGDYSMLLEVLFENTMELDRFIGELQYFGRTKTLIVFSTSVEHRGVGALGRVLAEKPQRNQKKLVFSGLVCYNP